MQTSERRLSIASAALAGALALLTLVPWTPEMRSWYYEYQFHRAFALGLQYGSDIVGTYGPLGFAGLPFFHPATFPWLITFQIALWSVTVWRLWRLAAPHRWGPLTGVFIVLALAPLTVIHQVEWHGMLWLPYLHVIAASLEWKPGTPKLEPIDAATAVLLGIFVVMKMSFLPLAVLVLLARACQLTTWRARVQWSGIFLATFLVCCWLGGQRLTSLPAFIYGSLQVMSGYGASMGLFTPMPWSVAGAMLAVCAALTLCGAAARGRAHWATFLVWLGTFFVILQNAFNRTDNAHLTGNGLALFSLAPIFAAGLTRRWWAPLLASGLSVLPIYTSWRDAVIERPDWDRPFDNARHFPTLVVLGSAPLVATLEQQKGPLRSVISSFHAPSYEVPVADRPLFDELDGARIVIPPALSGYASYTPWLTALHAERLERPGGPALLVMCGVPAIDGRFPTEVDNKLFLSLLTHFHAAGTPGGCAVFQRDETPRTLARAVVLPLGEHPLHASVPIPPAHAIWARLVFHKTLGARLSSLLTKQATLTLEISRDDGGWVRFTINPTMTADGFLLSPVLDTQGAMDAFYGQGTGKRVTAIRVAEDCPAGKALDFYAPSYEVELTALSR